MLSESVLCFESSSTKVTGVMTSSSPLLRSLLTPMAKEVRRSRRSRSRDRGRARSNRDRLEP